jgi:two-component sensor histidine kinase
MMPLKDDAGAVRGFLKILRDRTDKRREEEHRKLLLDELNHRVKNTLATVQSVAMQTIRTSETPAAFHEAFVARLMALSRGHDLLTRSEWRGASLAEVVRQTLAPYADGEDDAAAAGRRLSVGGPPVRLSPNAAVALNMTFHELATNAAKYGALSAPGGRVEVAWALDLPPAGGELSPGAVELVWRERGGPPVEPPLRRGFGTKLIERGVKLIERGVRHELAGDVRLEFAPEGVEYRARLPLSAMVRAS